MKSVSLYKHYSTLAAGPLLAPPSRTPFLSPSIEMEKHAVVHHPSSCFHPACKIRKQREGLCCGPAARMWKEAVWKWQTPGVPRSRQVRILTEELWC